MHRFLRFCIFITFCLSFVVITAGVLLYVYGYRFSMERGIFIYSGSLTIKTTPEEVAITIDGQEVPKNKAGILNQSYLVGGLVPGRHSVTVSAPGYTTWTRDVIIRSGLSTEFWNVFLVENVTPKTELKESTNTERLYPAPKSPNLMIFAKQNTDGVTLMLVDTSDDKQKESTVAKFTGYTLTDTQTKENLEWSADERYLLVPLQKDGEQAHFAVQIKKEITSDLNTVTGAKNLSKMRWNPKERTQIFYLDQHTLIQTDFTQTDVAYISRFEDVLTYDLSENYLFYVGKDGFVYRTFMDAEGSLGATKITREALNLDPEHRYTLITYDQARFTLQDENTGELWLYNRFGAEVFFDKILASGAKGAQFSNDGKKLLYYTDTEAFVYYLRDWKVQPIRTRGDTQPLLRLATPLIAPQWSFDYEHVLFLSDKSLKLIELDNREAQYLENVVTFDSAVAQFLPRFTENKLYFVVTSDSTPSSVQSIDFPKKTPGLLENLVQ